MGGPGSGKGRISGMLMDGREFNYIETGSLLRSLPGDSEIAQIMKSGALVPDEKMFALIESKANNSNHDIMFDGFPRTLPQAQWLVKNFTDPITVIYLNLPESIMIQRIHTRISEGSARADDAKEDIIRSRIKNFEKQTLPAIEFLRTAPGVKFLDIDARPMPEEIVAEIKAR